MATFSNLVALVRQNRAKLVVASIIFIAFLYGNFATLYKLDNTAGDKATISAAAPCTNTALVKVIDGLNTGELAALTPVSTLKPTPALSFADKDGKTVALSDFKGKLILLNLWATWCVPCRTELPTLDGLEEALGSDKFQVVAVNIDTARLDQRQKFWSEAGIAHLNFYADDTAKSFQDIRQITPTLGLPTTVLIDSDGCLAASLPGPAKWDSPEAMALIKAAVGRLGG